MHELFFFNLLIEKVVKKNQIKNFIIFLVQFDSDFTTDKKL